MALRVGIEVSAVTTRPTGVGTYIREILRESLRQTRPDEALLGFSSGLGEIDAAALAGLAAHRHLRLPTRGLYQVWNAARRPRVDRLLGGVDVYHATNFFLPPVQRARRLLTVYDLTFLRHPAWCSPKIVGPFSRHIHRFVHEADAVLTCSEASRQDIATLLDCPADKVHVAYGAPDAMFRPHDPAEARARVAARHGLRAPYVLFVSTLEPRKNLDGLLRAFAQVQRETPHTLVLVGAEGWNQEPVDAMIARHGLAERVQRLGYVQDRAELPWLYAGADAFVLPSFYEGFGIPVLEAMACGCPTIATRRASLPEAGGDAVEYVDPDDPADIARGLLRVLHDSGHAEALRARGLAQAARFTWGDAAARVLALYRELAR